MFNVSSKGDSIECCLADPQIFWSLGSLISLTGTPRLPKGSNVVPFGVCYGFLVRDYNILPRKELHRRVWVGHGNGPQG